MCSELVTTDFCICAVTIVSTTYAATNLYPSNRATVSVGAVSNDGATRSIPLGPSYCHPICSSLASLATSPVPPSLDIVAVEPYLGMP